MTLKRLGYVGLNHVIFVSIHYYLFVEKLNIL